MSENKTLDIFDNIKRLVKFQECRINIQKPTAIEDLAAYISYPDDYKLTKIDISALETMLDGEFMWATVDEPSRTLCVKIRLKEPPDEEDVK